MRSLLVFLIPALAMGFCPTPTTTKVASSLAMAPKFDKSLNKWVPSKPEEGPEYGYDIWGSLLRQGPVPFFNRIFKANDYEQGVLKFMAGDKVDRMTAQAEMDAYLQNPNDWAYNRVNNYNVDYLSLDQKKIVLTLTWAALILSLLGRGGYCAVTGDNYWSIFLG